MLNRVTSACTCTDVLDTELRHIKHAGWRYGRIASMKARLRNQNTAVQRAGHVELVSGGGAFNYQHLPGPAFSLSHVHPSPAWIDISLDLFTDTRATSANPARHTASPLPIPAHDSQPQPRHAIRQPHHASAHPPPAPTPHPGEPVPGAVV